MGFLQTYESAVRDGERARLKKVLALRALLAEGRSQSELASQLGVTQPAVSYQVAPERTSGVRPRSLAEAGGDILREVAENRGFTRLAMFGSAARGADLPGSDLDLIVQPPAGAGQFELGRLEELLESIAGCSVDLVSYGGLDPRMDRDIIDDAVLL